MTTKPGTFTTAAHSPENAIQRMARVLSAIVCAASFLCAAVAPPVADAQGSRKDDIVLGPTGHPVSYATVTVCQAAATGTPCSPLATIFTDATLTVAATNPFHTDGLGNYHFYAPSGRYMIQISGASIAGTITYPDVILAPDTSTSESGSDISAFSLALGGNLTVGGNATVTGTLTTSTFSPGAFTPSSLSVTGNETLAGPRPRIDVTAYGAKGDNTTDDTAAIQAAITAACAGNTTGHGEGSVYFPPGQYLVKQTQTPSTAPIFTICGALHLLGGNGNSQGGPFVRAPSTNIAVVAGSSPNAAPVFAEDYPYSGVTIENLNIDGYNEAVRINGASYETFRNTYLSAGTTGLADNTALKITNTFWIWYQGGGIQVLGGAPLVLMTGETNPGNDEAVQLLYFSDVLMNGQGNIQYIQRVDNCCGPPGDIVFRNITREAANTDFFSVTNATGHAGSTAMPQFDGITFDHVNDADQLTNSQALINFNSSGSTLSGVTINHSIAGGGIGGGSAVIRMTAGALTHARVDSCANYCNNLIVDASGKPAGGAILQNANGTDVVVNTTDSERLRTDFADDVAQDGPALRATSAGNLFSTMAIDPAQGLLFSDGASYGYTAQLFQNAKQSLDIGFASSLPPTGVTGTATTGGTLAAGTYYYYVSSTTANSGSCASSAFPSAVSLASAAVVVGGSNNAANITWTPPVSSVNTIVGYCVVRLTTPLYGAVGGSTPAMFVAGASTASATDTGSNFTVGPYQIPPVNYMQAVHRFTPTSLGIDTTSPQYNLDVNGSAAVNSLNSVQKAERFAGSDAAAQINACLTAASTSSGVCDARGLMGTLTATSHITIPAATTLMWGQARLTINDTTNNDAIELMGDGSSLVGYQESGGGTVPRPDTSGYIACAPTGCTTVKNPNAATRNVDWVHITGMNLQATGSGSTVLNLTSMGHSDIENNRFVMGTGGSSYGIFGDTSTGGFDSTNTLIKHNEFDPQFQNDRCLRLAGVFNVIEMELNTCILPAANTGTVCFEIAKDSNGNYPNNDEFYGNDCEGSTTSFGQIGYNIINADSVTIGPNNRCENVYNCFQFPVDGSAVGIHVLDPYISVSANSVVKPNEPSTSQIAIDNNGPNWLPSMHFGFNDLSGRNLIGNAGFEGWSGSTSLFYWGGVSGTNINQAGSGIYAQNTSAGTPADGATQGTYNVKIGDNATAGLGVNSGCIQVDATMNYTLAFRVAASSTSVNFRPGFRFYSDANCTEANRITNIATNARVLAPSAYAGYSSVIGSGPNWQSSNASLSYNNGITCNCNVTGADWQVAAANAWTPTRNFAITFRVPNAYSIAATVAQSMRVFVLENTAANPNQIFVDDMVLSQGPVSPNVPLTAALADSGSPMLYGNLTVAGGLTVGSQPATLTTGSPAANDCASFTGTNVQDSGSACPSLFTKYAMGFLSAGEAPSANNAVDVSVIYLPNIQFSKLTTDVSTTDSSTSDFYSWAITDTSGNVKCSVTAVNLTVGGASDQSCTQGTVTLANGPYLFVFTGNATTGKIAYSGTAPLALSSAISSTTSSSGAITFPIAVPSAGVTYSGYGLPAIILH